MTTADPVRVLIADDNELLRMGLVSLLDAQDQITVVAEAVDGVDAVELAAEHRPDVALLDVRMPRMDGVEAAGRMPEGTRVIMLTYTDEPDVINGALSSGALGYLVHGAHSPDEVVQAVISASHGMAVLGPAATAVMLARSIDHGQDATATTGDPDSFGLTEREREIMGMIAEGLGNRQIAQRCFLAEKTVKNHVNRIFAKLAVSSRAEAVSLWLRPDRRSRRAADERGVAATAMLMTALVTGLAIFVLIAIPYGEASDEKAQSQTAADAAALAGAEGARDDLVEAIGAGDVPGAWQSVPDLGGLGYVEAETYASRNGTTLVEYSFDYSTGEARAVVEGAPVEGTRPRSVAVAQVDMPFCDLSDIETPDPLPPPSPTATATGSPSPSPTTPTATPPTEYPSVEIEEDCGPVDLKLKVTFDEDGNPTVTVLLPPGQLDKIEDAMDVALVE